MTQQQKATAAAAQRRTSTAKRFPPTTTTAKQKQQESEEKPRVGFHNLQNVLKNVNRQKREEAAAKVPEKKVVNIISCISVFSPSIGCFCCCCSGKWGKCAVLRRLGLFSCESCVKFCIILRHVAAVGNKR